VLHQKNLGMFDPESTPYPSSITPWLAQTCFKHAKNFSKDGM